MNSEDSVIRKKKTKKTIIEASMSLIIGLILTLLTFWLGNFGNDVYEVDFSQKSLLNDINSIIVHDSTMKSFDDFIIKSNFSKSIEDKIRQIDSKNKMDEFNLISSFFALSERYPSLITGNLIKESKRWSTIVLLVVIFMLTSLISYGLITSKTIIDNATEKLEVSASDWVKSEKNKLSDIISKEFGRTIESFTIAHKGFLNGIYTNYPYNFTPFFDTEINKHFESSKSLSQGQRSLYIRMEKIGIEEYSQFAIDLLNFTKTSVYSTTYFNNNSELIDSLGNSKFRNWINDVNQKKNEGGIDLVIRVHIFDNNESFRDFIEKLQADGERMKYYLNHYAKIADYFKTYHIKKENGSNKSGIKFFGEYIIFDEQIMLKYDENFEILELFIGSIVNYLSGSFNPNLKHFQIENATKLIELFKDESNSV